MENPYEAPKTNVETNASGYWYLLNREKVKASLI